MAAHWISDGSELPEGRVPAADGAPRCDHCRARLDIGPPHLCKEFTFAAAPAAMGTFFRGLLNPEPARGAPYTHTFAPPEPTGEDEDGNLIYPEPGPAYTLTEGGPYRWEVFQDTPRTGCYWPLDDRPLS